MSLPTTAWLGKIQSLGGVRLEALYELTIPAPAAQTYYLAHRHIAGDELYAGSPAYHGIVLESSGIGFAASLGGESQANGLTLKLSNARGTYGAGGGAYRRFSDRFTERPAGATEPYDLDSATLVVKLTVAGLAVGDARIVGTYRIVPTGKVLTVDADENTLTLEFGEDPTIWKTLPARRVTKRNQPNAPPGSLGLPIPIPFGNGRFVPGILVDGGVTGKYLFCESPAATPVAWEGLFIEWVDPETGATVVYETVTTPSNPVFQISGADTWQTLTGPVAQTFRVDGRGFFCDAVRFRLRKTGASAPAGTLEARFELLADEVPGGVPVGPYAVAAIGADVVDAAAWVTVPFDTAPPFIPGHHRRVAVTLTYGKQSGAGDIDVSTVSPDVSQFGAMLDQIGAGWVKTHGVRQVVVEKGLNGGGLLVRPALGGTEVHGFVGGGIVEYSGTSYPGLVMVVGTDTTASYDGLTHVFRSFFRIDISALPASGVTKALLGFFYGGRGPNGGAAGAVILQEIADFSTLDKDDWDPTAYRTQFGAVISGATDQGTWIEVDITAAFNQAKTDTLTHMAFRLSMSPIDEADPAPDGKWYEIVSPDDNRNLGPALWVDYGVGKDLQVQLDAVAITLAASAADGDGQNVCTALTARNLGAAAVLARLRGIIDDGAGTYSGTPSALLNTGPTIARFLLQAPVALGLPVGSIDLSSFEAARNALVGYPELMGVVIDELSARDWLARLGRCCRSAWYVDEDGKIAVATLGVTRSVTDRMKPWEHGPLTLRAANPAGYPWSRVEVFSDRSLTRMRREPTLSPEQFPFLLEPGWNEYRVIAADMTDPPDVLRQAQATVLEARYGIRGNGVGTGPTAENTFHFAGPGDAIGVRIRNELWDSSLSRPDTYDELTIALVRRALGWRLMDEIGIESYAFPGGYPSAQPGEVHWAGAEWGSGPVVIPGGTVRWYCARRAICSVRSLAFQGATSEGRFPVQALCKLLRWEHGGRQLGLGAPLFQAEIIQPGISQL